MSDDVDVILRKKALEMLKLQTKNASQTPQKHLSDEEAVEIVKKITKGERAAEIVENALALYKPYAINLFKKIAELHLQGVVKELADFELYEMLRRAGLKVPVKTEIKIVRHGREYKIGES